MKLKSYINKTNREHAKETILKEIDRDFGALYKSPKKKLLAFVRAKPVLSFILMISIIMINFCFVFYLDSMSAGKDKGIISFKDYIKRTPIIKTDGPIEVTVDNFQKIKEIKDSLSYYSEFKGHLSHNDTVTLKRLLSKYAEIDPTIFKNNLKENNVKN